MYTGFDPGWVDQCEPVEVYKHDARSRVWRIDTPGGLSFVIKQFEYNPFKQRLAALLWMHPGQRERWCCDRLYKAWIPVVPIIASGKIRDGTGMKLWLATPYMGKSLYNLIHHGELSDAEQRGRVLDAVGVLTGGLVRKGLFNRDHKASNIIIDGEDRAWLIDVGAIRFRRGRADTRRMLGNLRANMVDAGASQADLERLDQACRLDPQPASKG
jgi:tRNA A-37 threonylcarbamoyl transferase component Bud32